MSTRVGLDLSLNSTGIAVRRSDDNITHCWFFRQRARERGLKFLSPCLTVTCVEFDKDADKMTKICIVVDTIKSVMSTLSPADTKVMIESYSFASTTTCLTQLAELGGAVRYAITSAGFRFTDVPPTTLKKQWCRSGRATKEHMYVEWMARGLPDLAAILGTKCATDKPGEDIVDAVALTWGES